MKQSIKSQVAAAAAFLGANLLLLASALPASAAQPDTSEVRAKTIALSDLDLSTAAGMNAARERVHQMARRLCLRVEEDLDASKQPNYVKCVEQAMAAAQPRLIVIARRLSTEERTADNRAQ